MKKITILIFVMLLGVMTYGQGRGGLGTIAVDTIKGANTVNFAIGSFTGSYNTLAITALCDEIGGTSDGTLTLFGSLDNSNWVFINGVGAGVITASPMASIADTTLNSITITDALVASWVVEKVPYRFYRIAGVGTSGDTTSIALKYMYK